MPHPATSIKSATQFFQAIAAEQAANLAPLPHIVEKSVPTPNGACRLAWCQSTYGSHWEIGSTQSGIAQPTVVFRGELNEATRQALARFLESLFV
ncbi:MAG: hypothetical protein IPM53_25125 [Anaerolineaceae bacterium]|nr:hypothetical protein [Anaerolineaceae bacterium]